MGNTAAERLEHTLADAFGRFPDVFRPLLQSVPEAGDDYARSVAHVKRFLEHWSVDREFRRGLADDPRGTAARYGLTIDAEEIRFLWDDAFHREVTSKPGWRAPRSVQRYRVWINEKLVHRDRLKHTGCVSHDPRHAAWRARQVNRGFGHLGPGSHAAIIHAPFAVELSDGCSVGCWFCGVSAEKKRADFRYTDENAALWRDCLAVLKRVLGPAASAGFCYWATDPLDNPDYERFCLDVAAICGKFPQTTTAQPQKNLERTRALLKLSQAHGCEINRFSILSLSIFQKVMQAFTPEELLYTELVNQNREASQMQSNAGKARGARQLERRAEEGGLADDAWREAPGTIACVSGFLINMVRRTVRLITPCPSSPRWSSGYWTYEEGRFETAADFAALLEGMMARHMSTTLRAGDVVRLRPDLRLESTDDGFRVHAYGGTTTFEGPPHVREVGEALARGGGRAGEIAVALEDRSGWPAEQVMDFLNQVFDQGLLDEEPAGTPHNEERGDAR